MNPDREWARHTAEYSREAWVVLRHGTGAGVCPAECRRLVGRLASSAEALIARTGVEFIDGVRLTEAARLVPPAAWRLGEAVGWLKFYATAARLNFGVQEVGHYGQGVVYDPALHRPFEGARWERPVEGAEAYVIVPGYRWGSVWFEKPTVKVNQWSRAKGRKKRG